MSDMFYQESITLWTPGFIDNRISETTPVSGENIIISIFLSTGTYNLNAFTVPILRYMYRDIILYITTLIVPYNIMILSGGFNMYVVCYHDDPF